MDTRIANVDRGGLQRSRIFAESPPSAGSPIGERPNRP